MKQQVDALKAIFERESRELDSRREELESALAEKEGCSTPAYCAARDQVIAQEGEAMSDLAALLGEVNAPANTADLFQSGQWCREYTRGTALRLLRLR